MPDAPQGRPTPPRIAATEGGWRQLLRAGRPRATKANALAAALALLLGFALATQVHQTRSQGLSSLRQSDLVRILDNVSQESTRLDAEARSLQTTRDQLASGSSTGEAALKAAQERLDTLQVLSGTIGAHGPGIRLTVGDPSHKVTSTVLLDAIEELRDAGAEAIQLGAVRVVASSYLSDAAGGVAVDGTKLTPPYVFLAIGDAQTLASAMQIPGGLTESVRQLGATPTVTQVARVDVGALHSLRQPRYARPVPSSAPGK